MRHVWHSVDPLARERGYSLVELMVAILIALFLIAGVLTVEQSVHNSYADRSGLAQLDNDERFTVTLLTEIAQSAGYYPDPATTSQVAALPVATATAPNGDALSFASGQAIYGLHNTTTINDTTYDVDSIGIRFMTASGDGIPLCDGSSNETGSNTVYTNYFYIGTVNGTSYLYCALEAGNNWSATAPVQLVENVEAMQISYGLHTTASATAGDYSVDTYVPAANMTDTDWSEVTAVRIAVTFMNPLQAEAGQQAATFTKVIALMSRTGGS